jgi:hypothetical protein
MLEIIISCILLYAGEEIKPESPWNVVAVEALSEPQQGMPYYIWPPASQGPPLARVRVTIKRPIAEGETVTLPKSCRSEVEVRKP